MASVTLFEVSECSLSWRYPKFHNLDPPTLLYSCDKVAKKRWEAYQYETNLMYILAPK